MAMIGLRKKSPVIWLLLVFCLLLGLTTTLADFKNADKQMVINSSKPVADLPEIPVEVNDTNLDRMLKLYSPFVVDCWEIGCRPCELIDPTINEMAKDLKGRIAFGKLCIDQNAVTENKYEISRTPTLLIFRNGTLVFKNIGNYPKQKLEEIILTVLRMR
ncbi:MAG: thioredoxin family protein [Methanothrix sp.]|nr:thioredoxin family protein [Methanothrix sp.]